MKKLFTFVFAAVLLAACTPPIQQAAKAEKEALKNHDYIDTFGRVSGLSNFVYTPQTGANKRAKTACEEGAERRVITTEENDQAPQYYTHCQKQ